VCGMDKEALIRAFNELKVPDMEPVSQLYELKGSFINLEYTLPSGQTVKLWNDEKTYYGAELCKRGSDRCYGLAAGDGYLLVCEYGEKGSDAEIVAFQRL
jgi:hypothetical protein